MFLLAIGVFIACCILENIIDSIDAYNYNKKGGFYAKYPCCKPKDWENKR